MPNVKRKPFARITVRLTVFFLLIIIGWLIFVALIRPKPEAPDTSDWQTGYVFFSVGDSWESVAVRSLTGVRHLAVSDSTPSHCGLVIRDADGVKLVHASTVAKKVVAETPEEYFANNGSYCLYALKPAFAADTSSLRHTLDSLIQNAVPFDFDFDHRDPSALYCTELVITAFELNGLTDFSSLRKHTHIYPDDLQKLCIKYESE